MAEDVAILGALIKSEQEDAVRVYVVTELAPTDYTGAEHWPRIVRRINSQLSVGSSSMVRERVPSV